MSSVNLKETIIWSTALFSTTSLSFKHPHKKWKYLRQEACSSLVYCLPGLIADDENLGLGIHGFDSSVGGQSSSATSDEKIRNVVRSDLKRNARGQWNITCEFEPWYSL